MALGVEPGNITTVLSVPLRTNKGNGVSNKEFADHLRHLARKVETCVSEGGIKELRLAYDSIYRIPYLEVVVFNDYFVNHDEF